MHYGICITCKFVKIKSQVGSGAFSAHFITPVHIVYRFYFYFILKSYKKYGKIQTGILDEIVD